jgi:hypothetical protein
MSTDATFTILQLQERAARLPDLVSTAEPMAEVAVDDGIFRQSEKLSPLRSPRHCAAAAGHDLPEELVGGAMGVLREHKALAL